MRPEQASAVDKGQGYFESIWAEDYHAVPRFLWNAKMRFGKTFASYQLAKRLGAKRVLVVTFKPAVEDAWQTDLESHADFDGWQYLSSATGGPGRSPTRRATGLLRFVPGPARARPEDRLIKAKNEWVHTTNWDLVIFDEYHFGAWRESAKELFEGEDEKVKQKELAAEYNDGLVAFDEELDELGNDEDDFLPITTRAYLYLSGTPFKALATGEFIEEQIFNWTYTDEQRAKAEYAVAQPGRVEPVRGTPGDAPVHLPDARRADRRCESGRVRRVRPQRVLRGKGRRQGRRVQHKTDVQKWLDLIRGAHLPTQVDAMRMGTRPPFPYSDVRLLPYLQHSFWFLPNVAACQAMANLLAEKQNVFWHDYKVLSSRAPARASGWMRSRRCGRRSATATTRRRSPCRAASSPRASPCRSGPRS
jgi:hypothetical protein